MRLAFYKGQGRLFNKLIRAWPLSGRGPYSHVELALEETPVSLCYSASNWNPDGVRIVSIDLANGNWDEVPVHLTTEQQIAVLAYCQSMAAHKPPYHYDWSGILGFVLPFGEHCDGDRFCSESCVEALQQAGMFAGLKPWTVSPNQLYALMTKKS